MLQLVQIISHCSVKLHAVHFMIFFQHHLILSNRCIYSTMHSFCMDVLNDNRSNLLLLASEGRNHSAISFLFSFVGTSLHMATICLLVFFFFFVAAVVGGVDLNIFKGKFKGFGFQLVCCILHYLSL